MNDIQEDEYTPIWSFEDRKAAIAIIEANPNKSVAEVLDIYRESGLVREGTSPEFTTQFIEGHRGVPIDDEPKQPSIKDISKFDKRLARTARADRKKGLSIEVVMAKAIQMNKEAAEHNNGVEPYQGPFLHRRVEALYYSLDDKQNQQERLEEISTGEGAKDDEFIRHPMNFQILAKNQHNIDVAMTQLRVKVRFNKFTDKTIIRYYDEQGKMVAESVYEDEQRNDLWYGIDQKCQLQVPAEYFGGYIELVSRRNSFHPVRNYLNSLVWDKKERITKWLPNYAGVEDSQYVRAISAIFLVAAVKRMFEPGCKYDEMLILEGEQGVGKSSIIVTLCHDESWFSDGLPLNVDAKQVIERTAGKWLIEASELSGMHESKVEPLKSFLSRRTDGPTRMAYAHLPVEKPRQFVLIGTTNSEAYLDDSTGNRRFWPVKTGEIKLDELARDKDQLWAEAVAWYKGGASIRLEPNLYEDATKQQEARRAIDPWEEILNASYTDDFYRIPPSDPWERLHVQTDRQDRKAQKRVVAIMKRLKFQKMSVGHEDKIVHGWGKGSELPMGDDCATS